MTIDFQSLTTAAEAGVNRLAGASAVGQLDAGALLDQAGVAALEAASSWTPAQVAIRPGAPVDPRPPLPPAAVRELECMLADDAQGVEGLEQFIVAAAGFAPPARLLGALIGAVVKCEKNEITATRYARRVEDLAGTVGRWLAAGDPQLWSAAGDQLPPRRAVHDSQLEKWVRAAGMDRHDELEEALDHPRKPVRIAAAERLAKLPESAYARRMGERLLRYIDFSTSPASLTITTGWEADEPPGVFARDLPELPARSRPEVAEQTLLAEIRRAILLSAPVSAWDQLASSTGLSRAELLERLGPPLVVSASRRAILMSALPHDWIVLEKRVGSEEANRLRGAGQPWLPDALAAATERELSAEWALPLIAHGYGTSAWLWFGLPESEFDEAWNSANLTWRLAAHILPSNLAGARVALELVRPAAAAVEAEKRVVAGEWAAHPFDYLARVLAGCESDISSEVLAAADELDTGSSGFVLSNRAASTLRDSAATLTRRHRALAELARAQGAAAPSAAD
jgi:hypothetical protein